VSRIIFTEELIKSFHEKIIKDYPDLSLSTVDKICRAEFIQMKESMKSGKLEDFRLQYLFKIHVSPSRVMKQFSYMHKDKDRINPKDYNYYMRLLLNYVKTNQSKFNKYYDKIKECTGYTREQISRGEYLNNGLS
jgi:hypothetical protein